MITSFHTLSLSHRANLLSRIPRSSQRTAEMRDRSPIWIIGIADLLLYAVV